MKEEIVSSKKKLRHYNAVFVVLLKKYGEIEMPIGKIVKERRPTVPERQRRVGADQKAVVVDYVHDQPCKEEKQYGGAN